MDPLPLFHVPFRHPAIHTPGVGAGRRGACKLAVILLQYDSCSWQQCHVFRQIVAPRSTIVAKKLRIPIAAPIVTHYITDH